MVVVPSQHQIVARAHLYHSPQVVELLEVPCLRPRHTRSVARQPDDGRRRDELGREQYPRHLFRVVGEWQRGQARRSIGMCTRSTLGRRQVVKRFGRYATGTSNEHSLHGRATKTETTYGLVLDHVVDTA